MVPDQWQCFSDIIIYRVEHEQGKLFFIFVFEVQVGTIVISNLIPAKVGPTRNIALQKSLLLVQPQYYSLIEKVIVPLSSYYRKYLFNRSLFVSRENTITLQISTRCVILVMRDEDTMSHTF